MRKFFIGMTFFIAGCSSVPKPQSGLENIGREAVVASMNNESTPSWVKKASEHSLYDDGGQVVSVAMTSLPGDNRIEAGFKIAELNAKANLAKTIESRIETFTQLADEGADHSGQQLRSVITEAAKVTASNMRAGRRYWSKVAITDDTGTPRTELRFWNEVKMDQREFKKALIDAGRKAAGKPSLSEAFVKQVDKNFERLINADEFKAEDREPAKQE